MTHAPQPDLEGTGIAGVVKLQVPAASAYVAVLRSVAAGLAARCNLTLDEIEDLRIAVDEACALLLPVAEPGADLLTEFDLSEGAIVVSAAVAARPQIQVQQDGFGWTVLAALVSSVETDATDTTATITLTKRREPASP